MTRISVAGTVPTTGYLYVPRDEDRRFLDLARRERAFTVTGCRTMGKSSMVNRWQPVLGGEGMRVIVLDVAAEIGSAEDVEQWFGKLRRMLADFDDRETRAQFLRQVPEPGVRPARWLAAMLDELAWLSETDTLLVLDEFDAVQRLPYCQDLLAIWRAALHTEPTAGARASTRVCFLGLRAPNRLASPNSGPSSPWGPGLVLGDFESNNATIDQLASVLPCGGEQARVLAARVLDHTGGQPLLTMILTAAALDEAMACTEQLDAHVERFLAEQRDHPTNLFVQIHDALIGGEAYAALSTWRSLLESGRDSLTIDAPGAELLRDCGLLRSTAAGLEIKAQLFLRFFNLRWVSGALDHLSTTQWKRAPARGPRRDRKRVCIFNTGGTIGMVRDGDEIRAPKDAGEFIEGFPELEAIADIQFVPLLALDSVNVGPEHWATMAEEIYRRRYDYDGFVIAHGTDTMAWSASAVALALGPQLGFPVVFTGAQTTPDVRHGDASVNLIRSCKVAIEPIHEVVICFNHQVFRGVRAQKTSELNFDAFGSPTYPPLADINENIDVHRERLREREVGTIELHNQFSSGVLMLQLTPGLEPELYRSALELRDEEGERVCQGIIIQTLGAGNVSSISPFSMMPLIGDAIALSIPVVVSSPFPWDPGPARRYAPAKAPMELGAISSGEMTTAAAAAKFRWALAQARYLSGAERLARVRQIMIHDFVGEGVGYVIEHGASRPEIQP